MTAIALIAQSGASRSHQVTAERRFKPRAHSVSTNSGTSFRIGRIHALTRATYRAESKR